MISFYKNFFFFRVYEHYFSHKFKISNIFSLDAYFDVKNSKHKVRFGIKKVTYSVENSLIQDIDVIFSGFSKTVRTQIRKSEKEGIECHFNQDVKSFVDFYNAFASNKKIAPTSTQRIREMGKNFEVSFAILDGKILAAHSYLIDHEVGIVRLFHSASLRFDKEIDTQKIGRSNKLLHYRDMIFYKDQGYKVYDFGGYTENTNDLSLEGINQFKLSFGGKKVICTNYFSFSYILFKWVARQFKIID